MSSADLAAQARVWAADAQTVVDGWTSSANWSAQKDAQLKETIRRLGILMSTIATQLERVGFLD